MAATILIALNNTASPIELPNLGVTVPGSGQVTLTDYVTVYEALDDLDAVLTFGNIPVGNAWELGSVETLKKEATKWAMESKILETKCDQMTLVQLAFEAGRNFGLTEQRIAADGIDAIEML